MELFDTPEGQCVVDLLYVSRYNPMCRCPDLGSVTLLVRPGQCTTAYTQKTARLTQTPVFMPMILSLAVRFRDLLHPLIPHHP
jgi:hypothetical protein